MKNETSTIGGNINSYYISGNCMFYMAYIQPENNSIKESYSFYIIMKYEKN